MIPHIHIGPAGWSYPDWNGVVYPAKTAKGFDPLAYLAFYFNLIEINSTFYRLPSPETARRWTERIRDFPDFLFNIKTHRHFTHRLEALSRPELAAFKKAVDPVYSAGRLGSLLIQFPWSFRFTRESRLRIEQLVASLKPMPAAVEVRHGSWARPEAVDFIAETGAMMCGLDQPLIGDSLGSRTFIAQPEGAYFRLHGRNAAAWFGKNTTRDERYNYTYSNVELAEWTARASELGGRSGRLFVVLNNHFLGQAVANALEFRHQLTREKVPVPAPLVRKYPRLRGIAAETKDQPPGISPGRIQGDLFGEKQP